MEVDIPQFKFYKTPHLPWTQASTSDDKILTVADIKKYFYPMKDVYASKKMDGECTTIGRGFSHARSLDSKDHWSRHHIKQLAARLYKDIEPGWRICGENLLATHSIEYKDLDSFFYVFAVFNEKNERLSLDEMLEYCDFLDLDFVPILKRGPFGGINFSNHLGLDFSKDEGYVVANSDRFSYNDAQRNVAKFVRKGHVQTDQHWMTGPKLENQLKGK